MATMKNPTDTFEFLEPSYPAWVIVLAWAGVVVTAPLWVPVALYGIARDAADDWWQIHVAWRRRR